MVHTRHKQFCTTSTATTSTLPFSTTVVCPKNCEQQQLIYGAFIYTDNSPICTAGVHAGILKASTGGDRVLKKLYTKFRTNHKYYFKCHMTSLKL